MIRTPICELLGIEHPIALGGMGSIYSPALVAAVSAAGGLGAMGCHQSNSDQIRAGTAGIRELTNKPFALNFLLFDIKEDCYATVLVLRPSVIALAWPRPEQDIEAYIKRAHHAGSKVTFMAGGVPEAARAAECGADVIVAQGTEGGGHVGWQATLPLVPMVVDAVRPLPVLAAGGVADGRGLAAALALGADGVLLGTRFLATQESPLHPNFKQAIVDSDGHDTLLTEIPASPLERSGRRDVTVAAKSLHREMSRTGLGLTSTTTSSAGIDPTSSPEWRHRGSAFVHGPGCGSHSRHSVREGGCRTNCPGSGGNPPAKAARVTPVDLVSSMCPISSGSCSPTNIV
jgi:NAD(P)H-dependent flavin oxidoreductase YrpB (nitropropane dioxygenase family)